MEKTERTIEEWGLTRNQTGALLGTLGFTMEEFERDFMSSRLKGPITACAIYLHEEVAMFVKMKVKEEIAASIQGVVDYYSLLDWNPGDVN